MRLYKFGYGKQSKTMQGTMDPMVQRGNEQGIKDIKMKMRSLHIV
jgi:hypothetical protein